MTRKTTFILVSIMMVLIFILSCSQPERGMDKAVTSKIPELIEIKPEKPVKIKLKRNANGNYSWDLTGDSAEKVIEANRVLKEALNNKSGKE